MNVSRWYCVMSVVVCAAVMQLTGCAVRPKPIPAQYFQSDYEMCVVVVRCSEKPLFQDSGGGGLIGLMVSAGRSSNMKKKMEGISGDTVKELLRQSISGKLEDYFDLVEEDAPLATEIKVNQWGWYLPTTAFGIKTGSYQMRILGEVKVYDTSNGKKARIASVTGSSEQSLGDDPEADVTQEALLKAIDDFSTQVVDEILQNKT